MTLLSTAQRLSLAVANHRHVAFVEILNDALAAAWDEGWEARNETHGGPRPANPYRRAKE